jgi:hypothetical protein
MSWKPCRMHFFTSSQCFWMALTLQNLKLGGNLEFSWYSCNILRYCSNRCIVWFFIPENCPAQANRKFPVQLYVKIQILFEPPFWICKWANHLSFLAMLFLVGVRGTLSLVLCVMFCRSLFVLLFFFFWPLCCLSFFDLQILIIHLVSWNSSSI